MTGTDIPPDAVAAAKGLLRLEGDGEDALIARLCATAIAVAEAFVGEAIFARDVVPAPIVQGMAMLVAHLFENREQDAAPPAAVAALWRPYRRMGLGA